mgnify:CR=1 FL=1
MCNAHNNGFVTGLLWAAGAGVVIGNSLNNGFVTGWFKRLPLLCSQYVPQDNKGSLFVGRALVCVALHMPQDNKRGTLSWGEPFFVVVHLLYNRRL